MKSSRRAGTSLVEVLVVIVIFLIGILAIVQIFPGGFKLLSTTQKNTIATALGRSMIESLKNHADQLPDAITPVSYFWNGSQVVILKEPERFPGNLGPSYDTMDNTGMLFDTGGNPIGNWQFLTGANIARRVIGEGKAIPAPRAVGGFYGSLLTLQFAPLVYNPTYQSIFVVYGNDMFRRFGDPTGSPIPPRLTEFYVDQDDSPSATVYFPRSTAKLIRYRIELATRSGGERLDVTDYVYTTTSTNQGWDAVLVSDIVNSPVTGVEYDSVRVSRAYDDRTGGGFTDDPYEYMLLSQQLGLVLFNPKGYNYTIRTRGGRREQLIGRVSYDVYDWRIIREEFRVPDTVPYQHRLMIGGLKVSNELGPDTRRNAGIGIQAPDANGNLQDVDLVLQDSTSGGLFAFREGTRDPLQTSFLVNKSTGVITLLDHDAAVPGVQMLLLYPGDNTMTEVTVDGRALRALYMGKNEWAVQVMKPAARYIQTWGRPGIGEFYIGGSVIGNPLPATRLYFPPADAGRIVSIGELYYTNTNGVPVGPVQLTAKLQSNNMFNGLPYIQISDYFPDFQSFDYSYGTAAKSVKGASVAVRVLWNPDTFNLTNDSAENLNRLNIWMQGWRRQTVETYLQRGY